MLPTEDITPILVVLHVRIGRFNIIFAAGSMPPNSRYLSEEGVNIKSFVLVDNNEFDHEGVDRIFAESRNLKDNVADLKAQGNNLSIC